MEALSFVLSLSFFPPKESYSIVCDKAEERREKGVTMNSILNSLFTSFDWFFFLTCFEEATVLAHKSEREHRKRAEKRKREFEEEHKHRHKRERKFLTRFGRKMPQITPFLKTSEYFLGKFSLTNDSLLKET